MKKELITIFTMSTRVKEMLMSIDMILFSLTDQRYSYQLDRNHQISKPFQCSEVFDEETLAFISQYLRKGAKKRWFESNCLVSFRQCGAKKQMYLYGDKIIRSKIDYANFPYRASKRSQANSVGERAMGRRDEERKYRWKELSVNVRC